MPRSWTDHDLQKIAGMMRDGMSARQIGDALGVSRNVIIGKVFRVPTLKAIGWRNIDEHGRGTPAPKKTAALPSIAIAPNRSKNVRGGHLAKPISNPVGVGVKNIRAVPRVKTITVAAPIDAPSPLNLLLMDLHLRFCRWPVSGSKEHTLFCGHETDDVLTSFCPHHRARAYQPRQSMKVAA